MGHFRYSLRSLLAAAAVVGIGAALWIAEPSWRLGALEALLLVFVPAAAITFAVHSTRTVRAWWIGIATGSAFTTMLLFLQSTMLLAYDSMIVESPWADLMRFAGALSFNFRSAILAWALAPIVGVLCALTHYLLTSTPTNAGED